MSGYLNKADFYDLFGPTKVGRRGFGLIGEKKQELSSTIRIARWTSTTNLAGYSGLDRLPDYQNVIAITHAGL